MTQPRKVPMTRASQVANTARAVSAGVEIEATPAMLQCDSLGRVANFRRAHP